MIKLIKPYTRIRLPYLAKELNIDVSEVENLLVQCILDGTVNGKMDQVTLFVSAPSHKINCHVRGTKVQGILELEEERRSCQARYVALDRWTTHLSSTSATVANRVF